MFKLKNRTVAMQAEKKVKILNTKDGNIKPTSIENLPDFCLDRIFQYLSIYDRIRIERVCKRWQHVSKDSWYSITKLDSTTLNYKFPRITVKSVIDNHTLSIKEILKRCGKYLISLDLRTEEIFINHNETESFDIISKTCQKIQVLNASNFKMKAKQLINMIPICEQLTTILFYIHDCIPDCEKAIIKFLRKTKKLKHFWTSSAVVHLDSFPESIEEIRLNECFIKASLKANTFNNMHTLILKRPEDLDDDSLKIISKMSNLKKLKLISINRGNKVTSNGMKLLKNLENLERLDIRGNRNTVTDEVIKEIANNCRKIVFLNISHNNLTDRCILELSKLKGLRYLVMRKIARVTGEYLWGLTTLEILTCCQCYEIKTENLCILVERLVDLKKLDCFNCNINHQLLEVAAEATARRGNETVLNIRMDFTSEEVAPIVDRSPKLKLHSTYIHLQTEPETENCDGRFNDDDWCVDKCFKQYELRNIDTDDESITESDTGTESYTESDTGTESYTESEE